MSSQLYNTVPDILRIHTIATYLNNEPRQTSTKVLDEQLVISPSGFLNGKKSLAYSLSYPTSADYVPLCTGYNTIYIYSRGNKLFNVRINGVQELTHTSLFAHSGDPIDIEVCNPSTYQDITIRFIIAKNELVLNQ